MMKDRQEVREWKIRKLSFWWWGITFSYEGIYISKFSFGFIMQWRKNKSKNDKRLYYSSRCTNINVEVTMSPTDQNNEQIYLVTHRTLTLMTASQMTKT